MDPLTHALSGAILGRGIPKEPLPFRTILLLAGMAMLPDIDIVLRLVSDNFYLIHHRGVTHSLLMLPLWIWLIRSLLPASQQRLPLMPWLIGLTLTMHILLDLITSFGTMIFSPLSDLRATIDLVFIIDPLFTLLMAVPLILMPILRHYRRAVAVASLAMMGTYLLLTMIWHEKGLELARHQHPTAEHVYALPQPFSPFRWMLVASYPESERRALVDFMPGFNGSAPLLPERIVDQFSAGMSTSAKPQWQTLPALRSLAHTESLPGIAFYRWFARFPVVIRHDEQLIELADLRFETMNLDRDAFRLRVELGEKPRAWLVWRGEKMSELTDLEAPATSW